MKYWRAFVFVVVVVIVAVGFYYVRNKNQEKNNNNNKTEENNASTQNDEFNQELAEPEKIDLSNLSELEASGIANRVYTEKKFIHTITAILPTPAPDQYYEGWLHNSLKANDFFSTGKLRQEDGRFFLEYDSDRNLSEYTKVVVTLQKNSDQVPEKNILSGEFSVK